MIQSLPIPKQDFKPAWAPHELRHLMHRHPREVGDINGDSHLDMPIVEMGSPRAGDKRLDILVKPYNHRAPRVDALLNQP